MSKLKDKLSANMRAVKASQAAPTPAKVIHKAAEKPATNPPPRRAPVAGNTLRDEVPNSSTELFPTRVWPD